MADQKISAFPTDSSLDGNHYMPLVDPTGPTTKRTLLSTLAAWFFDQLNIPAGSGSPVTRAAESGFNYIASGLVWSGDAYASTRNASMTSGVVYINGRRILISAVTARAFTASKDTYVDILDNANGTGTLVYTEVANNAASPSLAANSMRIGIIVTGATNIAAAASINQGSPLATLPVASSVIYTVCDSLGNLICNRSPNPVVIGMRRASTVSTTGTTYAQMAGMTLPVIVPTGRNIEVEFSTANYAPSGSTNSGNMQIYDGAVVGGTALQEGIFNIPVAPQQSPLVLKTFIQKSGLATFNMGWKVTTATGNLNGTNWFVAKLV